MPLLTRSCHAPAAMLAALGLTLAAPVPAASAGLDCDPQRCVITVTENLSFEAAADAVLDGLRGIEVYGDVIVHTPQESLSLTRAELVFRPNDGGAGPAYELYGTAVPPMAELPLLDQARLRAEPIAAVGLVSRATLKTLLEDDDYRLPLAENLRDSERDPVTLIEPAYLFFHFETGLSLDLPLGDWLGIDEEQGEHNPFAFAVPGDKSVTFILDPVEPYFFLSQDARALLMEALGPDYQEANAAAQARQAEQADPGATGDTASADGQSDPAAAGATGQEATGTSGQGGQDTADGQSRGDGDDQDGGSLLPELGEVAFSWLGGIPFEPLTTWGLPADAGRFKGHVYLDATVPLYKFIELTGKVVTHTSADGFEQGGNGDVQVAFDLIPNLLSFSFPLGNASAGVRVTEDDVVSYFSGINAPDYSFLPPVIPVLPTNAIRVAGYISSSHPLDSRIVAEGSFGYDMSGFRSLTGLDLRDLELSHARLSIGAGGVSLHGRSGVSIHPSIALGGEAVVDIYFSPRSPETSYLEMRGQMLVAGVGLKPVVLRLDRTGLFVEGAFVTPLSEIALAGEITGSGPSLTGSAGIAFGVGEVRAAIEKARAKVLDAQRKVEVLNDVVATQRAIVTREREETVSRLIQARSQLAAAQQRLEGLEASIAGHYRAISSYRSQISSKYRWYRSQPWYKKAWAWSSYAAYRAAKNAQIAWRYGQTGALNVAKAGAQAALEVAKGTVRAIEASIAVIPIDADPRVSGPLLALQSARAALTVAEAALPKLPDIDADIRGDVILTLSHQGVRGRLNASANGVTLAGGRVTLGTKPEACIDLATLGALCVPF